MKPHLCDGWMGRFEQSRRGAWFEGRHKALCWCGLTHQALVHRLAGQRKMKSKHRIGRAER